MRTATPFFFTTASFLNFQAQYNNIVYGRQRRRPRRPRRRHNAIIWNVVCPFICLYNKFNMRVQCSIGIEKSSSAQESLATPRIWWESEIYSITLIRLASCASLLYASSASSSQVMVFFFLSFVSPLFSHFGSFLTRSAKKRQNDTQCAFYTLFTVFFLHLLSGNVRGNCQTKGNLNIQTVLVLRYKGDNICGRWKRGYLACKKKILHWPFSSVWDEPFMLEQVKKSHIHTERSERKAFQFDSHQWNRAQLHIHVDDAMVCMCTNICMYYKVCCGIW